MKIISLTVCVLALFVARAQPAEVTFETTPKLYTLEPGLSNILLNDKELVIQLKFNSDPVADLVTISAKNPIAYVTVKNLAGRSVWEHIVSNPTSLVTFYPNLKSGVYEFHVGFENGEKMIKRIKD